MSTSSNLNWNFGDLPVDRCWPWLARRALRFPEECFCYHQSWSSVIIVGGSLSRLFGTNNLKFQRSLLKVFLGQAWQSDTPQPICMKGKLIHRILRFQTWRDGIICFASVMVLISLFYKWKDPSLLWDLCFILQVFRSCRLPYWILHNLPLFGHFDPRTTLALILTILNGLCWVGGSMKNAQQEYASSHKLVFH